MSVTTTTGRGSLMYLVLRAREIVRCRAAVMREPVGAGERQLGQVVLAEHVLIPNDELEQSPKALCDGLVDGKIKGGILCVPGRIQGLLNSRRLLALAVEGRDDIAGRRPSWSAEVRN